MFGQGWTPAEAIAKQLLLLLLLPLLPAHPWSHRQHKASSTFFSSLNEGTCVPIKTSPPHLFFNFDFLLLPFAVRWYHLSSQAKHLNIIFTIISFRGASQQLKLFIQLLSTPRSHLFARHEQIHFLCWVVSWTFVPPSPSLVFNWFIIVYTMSKSTQSTSIISLSYSSLQFNWADTQQQWPFIMRFLLAVVVHEKQSRGRNSSGGANKPDKEPSLSAWSSHLAYHFLKDFL